MSDVVQQIKDKINIIDIVSPYVELKRSSKNFVGRCPFHQEKTPSFNVSPDRGRYHCFGCGVGGDIFNFVQEMEGVDFKEALKILAQKAGVELVPEDPKKKDARERLLATLEAATVFYTQQLEKERPALDYLNERGVKPETITQWRIGYAPGPPQHGWREAKDHLESLGYTADELLKSGIIKTTDSGKEPFDVFRDRIVFPLADPGGKMVAFSGRILHANEKAPKYVNSPETQLYKKSDLLYGYDKAKTGIRSLNFSLIVEGQFDVVMCHQAGYTNTVAVSGTALTLHHVQQLERMSDKVVLALDADQAGINAMKKSAQLMLGRGLDVKVAEMPLGKDPADIIQANPNDFKHIIGQSVHVVEFLLHYLKTQNPDERKFHHSLRDEVYPIANTPDSHTERYSLAKLIARQTTIPVDVVWRDMEYLREKSISDANKSAYTAVTAAPLAENTHGTNSLINARSFILAALEIIPEELKAPVLKQLENIDTSEFEPVSDADFTGLVFSLEQQFANLPVLVLQEELLAKLNQLKTGIIRKNISVARKELAEIERQGKEEDLVKVMQTLGAYEKQLREPRIELEIFQ